MSDEIMRRIAVAIAAHGSPAHVTPSGAILELMSALAREGEIEAVSEAVAAYCGVHNTAARKVLADVPAIVLNGYLYEFRKRAATSLMSWRKQNPDWSTQIKEAALNPARFTSLVEQFDREISAMEADPTRP